MTSPVAIFVYNRLDNTQKTIECLLANTLARETDVFVFSDGGKSLADGTPDKGSWDTVNCVRTYLHNIKQEVDKTRSFNSFTIVEREKNIYLEANITTGIQQVFEHYDRVIVLEDDICTSPYYLEYMNEAFDMYKDVEKVMHVSGFTNLSLTDREYYFTPHMSGWGWGTWRDRWQKYFVHYESRQQALEGMSEADMDAMQYGGVFPCLKSLDKSPIPWDICWETAIYKAGGLCLTPGRTLVRNIGLKNGTHFRSFDILQWYEFDHEPSATPISLSRNSAPEKDEETEALFAEAIKDWGIRYTFVGKIVRFLYKKFVK